jgi:hypothetical protein
MTASTAPIKIKKSDKVSREILFVAIARTFAFPAKYDWATGKAEYYNNNEWLVAFPEEKAENSISNNYDYKLFDEYIKSFEKNINLVFNKEIME